MWKWLLAISVSIIVGIAAPPIGVIIAMAWIGYAIYRAIIGIIREIKK